MNIRDEIVNHLDVDKDGKLTVADVQKALAAADAKVRTHESNLRNLSIVTVCAMAVGGILVRLFGCGC